jgi:hypothetical protein
MSDLLEESPLLSMRSHGKRANSCKKILMDSFVIFIVVIFLKNWLQPWLFPEIPKIISHKKVSPERETLTRILTSQTGNSSSASTSHQNRSVILPYLAIPPPVFNSPFPSSTWEGNFFSSGKEGLLDSVRSGLAVLSFSTAPITLNPVLKLTLGESNHLDAKILTLEINMRFSSYNETASRLLLEVDPGIEYVVNSTFRQWVKGHELHLDHGITLRVEFEAGAAQEPIGFTGQEVRFWLEVKALGVRVQGVARRGINQGIMNPVFPAWYASLIVCILTIFMTIIVWVAVHEGSRLHRPSQTAAGQGAITPFSIGLINLNLFFITFSISDVHNSFFLAVIRGIYLYMIIIWCVAGLGVFGKIVETLIMYQGRFAYTLGRILFILTVLMVFFHDRVVTSRYYDRILMGIFCYPLLQVIYIALFAKTSRHNYFVPTFHGIQYLATLLMAYWYHGSGSTFLNLKPRSHLIEFAALTTVSGLIIIDLQSLFGRLFCCCCHDDHNTDFTPQRELPIQPDEFEVNMGNHDPPVIEVHFELGPEIDIDDPAEFQRVLQMIQEQHIQAAAHNPQVNQPNNPNHGNRPIDPPLV